MNQETFLQGYIACALWCSGSEEEPLDSFGIEDLAPETLQSMKEDCEEFQKQANGLLNELTPEQAGHDFWLTRNHHGAGFWDRGLGETGKKLTEICNNFSEVDLYVGDDGMIYIL